MNFNRKNYFYLFSMKFFVFFSALSVCLLLSGCLLHDTELSIKNSAPQILYRTSIDTTLIFPDSTICTLSVKDLNDASLSCHVQLDQKFNISDQLQYSDSPFVFFPLNSNFSEKKIRIYLPGLFLSTFKGMLSVSDDDSAVTSIPIVISKQFYDSFNRFPINPGWWVPYITNDSTRIRFNFGDRRLLFINEQNQVDSQNPVTIGIRTNFKLSGDFHTSIEFHLRDDMVSGFEAGFFASTNPDTSRYSGKTFGIFFTGEGAWITLKCKSVYFQTSIATIPYQSGAISLDRKDSLVTFGIRPMGRDTIFQPVASFNFPSNEKLFIHMRFKVDDATRTRHCEWSNFRIQQGRLSFD